MVFKKYGEVSVIIYRILDTWKDLRKDANLGKEDICDFLSYSVRDIPETLTSFLKFEIEFRPVELHMANLSSRNSEIQTHAVPEVTVQKSTDLWAENWTWHTQFSLQKIVQNSCSGISNISFRGTRWTSVFFSDKRRFCFHVYSKTHRGISTFCFIHHQTTVLVDR